MRLCPRVLLIGDGISNVTSGTAPGCSLGVAMFTVLRSPTILVPPYTDSTSQGNGISEMPSLFRFLFVVGALAGLFTAGMWVLATKYEPQQQEEVKVVPGVKIRKE